MNSLNIILRVTTKPHLAYVGHGNRPLAKFLGTYCISTPRRPRVIELPVIVWGQKAELAAANIEIEDEVAVTGSIDFDSFSPNTTVPPRQRTVIIADTLTPFKRPKATTTPS